MNKEIKIYMSVNEAKIRYGIGQTMLYELFKKQDCPNIYKLGRKTLIPIKEFDEFFLKHTVVLNK